MKKPALVLCSLIVSVCAFSDIHVRLSDAAPLPRREISDVMKARLQKIPSQPGQTTKISQEPEGARLTYDGGSKYYTDWSKDYELITYDSVTDLLVENVFIIPPGGGNPVNVTPDFYGDCYAPNFHPGRNYVTFTELNDLEGYVRVWDISFNTNLYNIVMDDAEAGYWNDDSTLFFYKSISTEQLVLYDVEADEPMWVWNDPNLYYTAVFSPDNSHVIVSKNDDYGVTQLYKYYVANGEIEQLTFGDYSKFVSDYSPDGQWILYSVFGSERWEMLVMNAETNVKEAVFPDGPVINMMGSFSPDGQQLCYIAAIDESTFEVFVTDSPYAPETPDSYISIMSPYGGETFDIGSSMVIEWESAYVSQLTIEYSIDGGSTYVPIDTVDIADDQINARTHTYSWVIPSGLESEECLISIYSESDSDIWSESSDFFTIRAAGSGEWIDIVSPSGGERLTAGTTFDIVFDSSGLTAFTLQYSIDGGTSFNFISVVYTASTDEARQTYEWDVPDVSSEDCLIRIISASNSGTTIEDTSGLFTIQTGTNEPYISIISPNGGEEWAAGTTQVIQWNAQAIDSFIIAYSTDPSDETKLHVISSVSASETSSDGVFKYEWEVPYTPSSSCVIIISDTDVVTSDTSDEYFSIVESSSDQWIDVQAPEAGERWRVGTTNNIFWEAEGVGNVNIYYTADSGDTWNTIVTNLTPYEVETGLFRYRWTIPDSPSSTCYVYVESVDNTDIYDASDNPFLIIPAGVEPEQVWMYQTDEIIYYSSPAIAADGTIYGSTYDGYLYAFNTDGTVKWRKNIGQNWSSPVIGSDGTVYIANRDGVLFAFNEAGVQQWKYVADDNEPIFSTPAISSDGTIYFGTEYGTLHTVNPNGTAKMEPKTIGSAIFSSPAIELDGTVYIGTYDGILYAFSSLGIQKWSVQLDGEIMLSSPAIGSDGTVYIGTWGVDGGMSRLYAVSKTGVVKWSTPLKASISTSPAIGSDGTVYVTSYGEDENTITHGQLYAIDPSDGSILWNRYDTGAVMVSSPAVGADGTIYVGSNDWNMYAFNADGTINWSFAADGVINSSPTLKDNGHLYFFSGYGGIFCIDTKSDVGLADTAWPKFHQGLTNNGRSSAGGRTFISLSKPSGGVTLQPGQNVTVTWTSSNVNTVNILLSTDNGDSWSVIAEGVTASTGSYVWSIPGDIDSDSCKIRIVNEADTAMYSENAKVFVITSGSYLLLTSVFESEKLQAGSSVAINWEYNDVQQINIQYSTDGGSSWKNISTNVSASSGSYTWVIPEDVSTDCKIRIVDTSNTAIVSASEGTFSIVSSVFIQITAPKFNDAWTAGSTKEILWDFNGVSNVKIEFSKDDGTTWETVVASVSASSGSYSWTVPDIEEAQCRIRITSLENAAIVNVSGRFTIINPELSILHTPIASAQENQALTFTAQVTSVDSITGVVLHYDETGGREFNEADSQVEMTTEDGEIYTVTLDAGVFTAMGMEYYIQATDAAKRNITSPPDEGYYSITAEIEDIKSTETITGGSAQSAYRMVSIPLDLSQTTIDKQFEGRLPTGENGVDWRMFRFPAGSSTPVEYIPDGDNGGFEAFEPAMACWIISKNDFRLEAPGGTTVTTSEPYSITLKAGWNDIANPWMFDISWDDIENPSNANLDVLYEYNGSWSNPSNPPTTLEPWKGYAVRNLENRNVIIKFQPIPDGAEKSKAVAKTAIDEPDQRWKIGLTAKAGDATDAANYFGIRLGALDVWDRSDHVEPPQIGEYVSVSFPHHDWEKYPSAYTVDMRPPTVEMVTWDVDVVTNIEHEIVTVALDGTETLPEGCDILVLDAESGKQMPLSEHMFSFVSGSGVTAKQFSISVGSDEEIEQQAAEALPDGYLAAQCYPNPFNPSTTLQYQMSEQSKVVITIYNIIGQQVRRYDLGMKSPGTHSFVFNAAGLTSGMYLYKIDAGYSNVTNKMLFMK